MCPRFRRLGLGPRLFVALVAAVLISTFGIAAVLISSAQRAARQETFAVSQGIIRIVSDDIREFVSDTASAMASAARQPNLVDQEPEVVEAVLLSILAETDSIQALWVRDMQGRLLASVGQTGAWVPSADLVERGREEAIAGRTYISQPLYPSPGTAVLMIALPVSRTDSPVVGTIEASVSLAELHDIAAHVDITDGGAVFVVDSQGRAIAHSELRAEIVGQDFSRYDIVRQAVAGVRDTGFSRRDGYVDPTGRQGIAAYAQLPDIRLSVFVQHPYEVVFGPNYGQIAVALTWTLLFGLVLVVLGVYLVRSVTRPIAVLTRGANELASGNLSHRIELRTGDELQALANTLNTMAANLEDTYSEVSREHDSAVRSAKEARTLYRVSQALVSTLDLRERLNFIAENLSQVLRSEKITIWLVRDNQLVPTVSLGLTTREKKVFKDWRVYLEAALPVTKETLLQRRPIFIKDALSDERFPRELAERLGIVSAVTLPMIFEKKPIGYAIAFNPSPGELTGYQMRLAHGLVTQAAVAVQNVLAYERERRIAETLQRALLPGVPPSIEEFQIADRYEAAAAESEIGGDFYDLFQLSSGKVAIVMADVSGKGLAAGVHTAMVKYMLRAYAAEDRDPVDLISRLNRSVFKYVGGEMFVTLFYGVLDIDRKELVYVNAGHELPLLFGEERTICMRLLTTGTALGILEDYSFESERIDFVPGDTLLLYTDGATDVRRDREFLGIEGLESLFFEVGKEDADVIAEAVDAGIREYASGILRDDVALLVLKYRRRKTPVERALET